MRIDKTDGIGAGNNYSYWNRTFTTCTEGAFTRSTDNANSFEDCIPVDQDPFWGTLAVANDGTLYITGRNSSSEIVVVSSTNARDPNADIIWDEITFVDLKGALGVQDPINPQGLMGQCWIDTDKSGGPNAENVYVLASIIRSDINDPADVMFARSTDGGANFEEAIRINTDAGTNAYQWMGTMSVAPNGRIDVVWLDTRDANGGFESALYYSFSEDKGDSWSENTAISEAFDPTIGYPQQNKMGDYFDMVSDNEFVHVAWCGTFNGGQDVYYTRILPDGVLGNENNILSENYFTIYPNPINENSIIDIKIPQGKEASIKVYDILGRKMKVPFVSNFFGNRKIELNRSNLSSSNFTSGIYFATLSIENTTKTLKFIID